VAFFDGALKKESICVNLALFLFNQREVDGESPMAAAAGCIMSEGDHICRIPERE
jgi:hypothetical protein